METKNEALELASLLDDEHCILHSVAAMLRFQDAEIERLTKERDALKREEARTMEPKLSALDGEAGSEFMKRQCKELSAMPRGEVVVKVTSSPEREELIERLRDNENKKWRYILDAMEDAADMLESDACFEARERHTRGTLRKLLANIEAQQVAVQQGWAKGQYDYQTLFNALSAATTLQGGYCGVSVKAFENSMLSAAPPPPQADAKQDDCDDLSDGEIYSRMSKAVNERMNSVRVPMTSQEIEKCWTQVKGTSFGYAPFARAIEAHHGIGVTK